MLKIYQEALEVVRELVPVVAEIDRHDPDLTRQLKKARSSIPPNIAEGSHASAARQNDRVMFPTPCHLFSVSCSL